MNYVGQQQAWAKCLSALGLAEHPPISVSPIDASRRVYACGDRICKVVLTSYDASSSCRANDASAEFSILRRCGGVPGVPRALEHVAGDGFDALILERLPGKELDDLRLGTFGFAGTLFRLSILILRLASRRVSHNDIRPSNILVSSTGRVSLLDFDQATTHGFLLCVLRSFFGTSIGGAPMHRSFIGLILRRIRDFVKRKMPPRIAWRIKRILSRRPPAVEKLPELGEEADETAKTLLEAWKVAQGAIASSPGQTLAYYSFDYNGFHYPGERPWSERFDVLKAITDYSDRSILELGCNMGLLSSFLLKEMNARASLGVDVDSQILDAARLVAGAFSVDPTYKRIDFDDASDWEAELSRSEPDVVFALNVLNWVNDKDRLLRFLGRFDQVIFEGHDSIETETSRLRNVGFSDIAVVTVTERGRGLLHCRKQ